MRVPTGPPGVGSAVTFYATTRWGSHQRSRICSKLGNAVIKATLQWCGTARHRRGLRTTEGGPQVK